MLSNKVKPLESLKPKNNQQPIKDKKSLNSNLVKKPFAKCIIYLI